MQFDVIVPTVKDRIVQQAVRLVIEPIFESGFAEGSFGFRPGRGCHDALREVDRLIKAGYTVASKTRKSASGGGCRLGRLLRFDSA